MPNMSPYKIPMPTQNPLERCKNFSEVATGYTEEMAIEEAKRCLNCKNKPCVKLCVTLKSTMDKDEASETILAYCKKNLAKFSWPRKIEIMDSFPRTKMAKIDFMKLSDTFDPKAK